MLSAVPPPRPAPPTNVMPARTRFFGRSAEHAAVEDAVADGRLVTIVGPPGVGKSRLAREVALACLASRAHGLAGGCWSCEVDAARDREALVAAVLLALAPDGTIRDPALALERRGKILLILDGFESLVAPASELVAAWLSRVPELHVLVTSRQLLRIEGERVIELSPLAPDDALALFVDRASAITASAPRWIETQRATTQRLVAALDGLPLAIELAASRARLLSPAQLLENLSRHDGIVRGERHKESGVRALDEALEGSWESLDASERSALASASVFAGGFDLAAAERVLDRDGAGASSVLDVLQSLRDRSLLSTMEGEESIVRYTLLVTIRAYAASRLDARAREAVHARHADHYLSRFEGGRHGDDDRRALLRERENLLAVHERALGEGRHEDALRAAIVLARLASALSYDWSLGLLDAAMAQADATSPTYVRALESRGALLRFLGRVNESLETLAVAAASASGALHGQIMLGLGNGCAVLARWGEALGHFETAIAAFARLGDRRAEGRARTMLAACFYNQDRLDDAAQHLETALALQRDTGDRAFEGMSVTSMGIIALARGDLLAARAHLDEALATLHALGDRHWEAVARAYAGGLALEEGQLDRARTLLEEAATDLGTIGVRRAEAIALGHLGHLAVERGALDEALTRYRAALGWHRRTSPDYEGLILGAIAGVTALRGEVDAAAATIAQARVAAASHPRPTFDAAIALYGALVDVAASRQAFVAHDVEASRDAESRAAAALATHGAMEITRSIETRAARRVLVTALDQLGTLRSTAAAMADPRALVCDVHGRWFRAPNATRVVRLHTRVALTRLLRAFVERRIARPGEPLPVTDLLEAGWPGEKVLPAAGQERVYTAIATLRRLGLRPVLVRSDNGYAIARDAPFVGTEVEPVARSIKASRRTPERG